MTPAQDHIAFRTIEHTEAYLPGTGLTVWEVAWVARYHDGDAGAIARSLGIDCSLVREALTYADEHRAEIETEIHDHVSWTPEDVKRVMPRARILEIDLDDAGPATS